LMNGVRLDFNYVLPDQHDKPADLILIATKADGLTDAINAIQGFVHDDTVILALLNGVTSEDQIAARYGADKVLHSYFIGHGSTRSGNAITFDGVGRIVFGAANAPESKTPTVEWVCRFFDRAKIDYEVPKDILYAMWCKFVVNIGINQASAVFRANYGVFTRSEKVRAIADELMDEAVMIAHKVGVRNADKIMDWCDNFIRNMPPAFKSSMLQDIEQGKRTEVDIFGGAICELGRKYGVLTPQNELFVRLIKALEEVAMAGSTT
jgi:2-dehydropantoate 2-reductase